MQVQENRVVDMPNSKHPLEIMFETCNYKSVNTEMDIQDSKKNKNINPTLLHRLSHFQKVNCRTNFLYANQDKQRYRTEDKTER